MEKKLQKMYLTNYNLLIEQDLWQVHYQTAPIIFLKEFIKLPVNTDTMIKMSNMQNYKNWHCFLEYINLELQKL